MQLQVGANTIVCTNPNANGYAPGLDSITVGPIVNNPNLSAAITRKSGSDDLRLWQLTLSNTGSGPATQTTLGSFTVVSTDSSSGCKAAAVFPSPLSLRAIPATGSRSVTVPVVFSPACDKDNTFGVHAVFSANQGANVGTLVSNSETE